LFFSLLRHGGACCKQKQNGYFHLHD
jgi:hypothetical protein